MRSSRRRTSLAVVASMLSIACTAVCADECSLSIEATDLMQYSVKSLQVPATCAQVEVTLKNVGKQDAQMLGHDWVLARTADVTDLTNAGVVAGFEHGYLPPADQRILASTKILGGGQASSIKFSTQKLVAGGDYTFFCSFPGHAALMRGSFVFGTPSAAAKK